MSFSFTTNFALNSTLLASAATAGFMDSNLNEPDVLAMPDSNVSHYCAIIDDDEMVGGSSIESLAYFSTLKSYSNEQTSAMIIHC